MAMVTFGGAYAVLAYVAQQAVEHYGWLKPGEMLGGQQPAERPRQERRQTSRRPVGGEEAHELGDHDQRW
jgi:hypothetical protein